MIKDYVIKDYQEYVSLHGSKYPDELIRGLKHHERVPAFINNLIKELHTMEHRQRIKLSRRKIKEIVYDVTRTFLILVKRRADEMAMSHAERARLIAEANSKNSVSDEHAKEIVKELVMDKVVEVVESRDSE